jgi:hypothetical protein
MTSVALTEWARPRTKDDLLERAWLDDRTDMAVATTGEIPVYARCTHGAGFRRTPVTPDSHSQAKSAQPCGMRWDDFGSEPDRLLEEGACRFVDEPYELANVLVGDPQAGEIHKGVGTP